MQYYIDELYTDCLREWNTMYELFEEDTQSLSGCFGGEILESYLKNTELLLRPLDGIKTDLGRIFAE